MKKIFLIFTLFLLILILTGCGKTNEIELLKQKADDEIQYLDATLISILNRLNNISFDNYYVTTEKIKLNSEAASNAGSSSNSSKDTKSDQASDTNTDKDSEITVSNMKSQNILLGDRNKLDWDNIKIEIENLYSAWNSIIIDLYKLGINNEDILKFSNYLDTTLSNIKQENKNATLNNVANLYGILPVFMNSYSNDKNMLNVRWAKIHVINAYSSIATKDWDNIAKELSQAEQAYSTILGDIDFVDKKSYNVNKTYVTLKELQNSITQKDEDIFYIKYKNFMEEVNLL